MEYQMQIKQIKLICEKISLTVDWNKQQVVAHFTLDATSALRKERMNGLREGELLYPSVLPKYRFMS